MNMSDETAPAKPENPEVDEYHMSGQFVVRDPKTRGTILVKFQAVFEGKELARAHVRAVHGVYAEELERLRAGINRIVEAAQLRRNFYRHSHSREYGLAANSVAAVVERAAEEVLKP